MLKIVFSFAILCIVHMNCADVFESLLLRLECYRSKQPGCNKDFIDAYPELAWSSTNLTKATTHFYMFTNRNRDVPELMHKCAGGLPPNTKFNPKCKTEIFIPGFVSGVCNFAIFRELKNERLKNGCYNVILVDYMWGNIPDLVVARNNLKIVAKQLVIVIRILKKKFGLSADDFILSGHSYGAHVAGFVGQDEPIGTILGFDPAGVLFTENQPLDQRLDAGDAKCVQVIHCNAGQCLPGYFGVNFTCGTMDIWMNDGLHQPSCYLQLLRSFLKKDFIYGLFSLYPAACNHFQCLQYYRASMNLKKSPLIGVQCESRAEFKSGKCRDCGKNGEKCVILGPEGCECSQNGGQHKNYYIDTVLKCPYSDNSKINTSGLTCPAKY